MKHASLAALYRPQNFAAVAGQHMVTTVMSRAAAEDSVAPAYLLSGTRGVGKTTIARIFAKALNCLNAPTKEPCNQCDQCLKITQGSHVDVAEIDGASNNSVEDARALREHIGYAPMEGRYKVFIIDEAHMLSKSAFNALLKTLEEPPPRVVFIFATTEAHKFPITIISRCQHFILKRLSEERLVTHLTHVLTQENVDYDNAAVRMIARRAAGSVRDSMSLLGQTLAYDTGHLTVEATRQVLGLAGQDLFIGIIHSMQTQDCASVVELCQKLTDQGVDIGFFLRELTQVWRTLFLLREAGNAIAPMLNLADDELTQWQNMATKFSAPHIHAAWHMTLEAQRKIIHSPEPATALELLLLNLTLMPRLLPIAHVTPPKQETHTPPVQQESTHTSKALQVHGTRHIQENIQQTTQKNAPRSWDDFCTHLTATNSPIPSFLLRLAQGEFCENTLTITPSSHTIHDQLQKHHDALSSAAQEYLGLPIQIHIANATQAVHKSEAELKEHFLQHEDMQACLNILDARIHRVRPATQ